MKKFITLLLAIAWIVLLSTPLVVQAANTEVTGNVPLIIITNPTKSTTASSATITWTTNGASSSKVYYKKSTEDTYSSQTGNIGPNNSVTLSGLSAETTYTFYVESILGLEAIDTHTNPDTFTTTKSSGGGSGGGGGGGGGDKGAAPTGSTTLNFATLQSAPGVFSTDVTAPSSDGLVNLWIPKGTTLLNSEGSGLSYITIDLITPDKQPPAPEKGNIIGLTYDLGPAGATFNPPVTLALKYNPASLPSSLKEEDLKLAYWDTASKEWRILPDIKVDAENNIIFASLSHFSVYTIVYKPVLNRFVMSSLVISPSRVAAGQEVTIQASVKNEGIAAGNYMVNLTIDGKIQETRNLQLEAQSSEALQFSFKPPLAGNYQVNVNGLTGVLNVDPVAGSAASSLSSLEISTATANLGESVSLSAVVTNTGEYAANYKIDLKINGIVVESQNIAVPGNGKQEVRFTTTQKIPGVYTVNIGNLTGSFEVRKPVAAPIFNISDLRLSSAQTSLGKPVEISVIVNNLGDSASTFKLDFKADHTLLETREVSLSGKTQKTVTFEYAPQKSGEIIIGVNTLTATLTVITSPSWWWLMLLILGLVIVILTVIIVLRKALWKKNYGTWGD